MSVDILSKTQQKLKSFFDKQMNIVGVWLYGSQATGEIHDQSDWDIAVLFSTRDTSLEHLAQLDDLREAVAKTLSVPTTQVQIVDIAQAPIPLAFEVIQANFPLKGAGQLDVAVFENKIFSMYELDYYHHYQKYA